MVQEKQSELRKRSFGSSPFSLMRRMMSDFERVFEEPSRGPAIDVFERGDKLVVRADVPGYKKDDIELEVTQDGVILEGQRQAEHEEKESGYYRRERSYGSFRRLIPLPEGIDVEEVQAEMKDGVLEVSFPLPKQLPERKRIEIHETGESGETGETGERGARSDEKKPMH